MKSFKINKLNDIIFWAFAISIIFWTYLFFTTEPMIVHDAIGYEDIGRTIYQSGWAKFFEEGPNREPLYPFLISISMRIADIFSISYLQIQKLIQIMILLVTQIISLRLMKKLEINKILIAVTILYISFSPALINSTFSLFSEITTYPFILGIIYVIAKGWRLILQGDSPLMIILTALLLSALFCSIISVKAIFEYVLPIVLLPFLLITIHFTAKRNIKTALKSILFIVVVFASTSLYLHFYKSMNQKYNGAYAFTNRGSWMLYGTIARRTVDMTPRKVLAAISMVPGDGICNAIFGREECFHWTFDQTMNLGVNKMGDLANLGIPNDQMDPKLMELSRERILEHPFQYGFFHLVEGGRMFFWESTQIGFVTYPAWLNQLYSFTPFKNGLRLITGSLTVTAFFYLIIFIDQNKYLLLSVENKNSEKVQLCFFLFLIILTFIQLYAFFCILTRYSFPIVPLYILAISVLLQKFSAGRLHGGKA